MQGFSEQAGARFLLVSMADAMRLHPARDYFISQFSKPEDVVIDLPEKKLDDIMAQLGGRHYAMLGDLQEKAVSSGSEELKWTCDAHYNEIGHEWAADAILKFLKNHPELIE